MKLHRSKIVSGALAAALLVAAPLAASAHHSAAPFDMERRITLTGTVERWVWTNPHSWLYMRVTKADGTTEVWGVEAGSAGMLARSGWNSADMKHGDRVTVTASPSRNGKPIALIHDVRLADGRMLTAGAGAPEGPPRPRMPR